MPKYYFDVVQNGTRAIDQDGTNLAHDDDAHCQAVQFIADLAQEEIPNSTSLTLAVEAYAADRVTLLVRATVRFSADADD